MACTGFPVYLPSIFQINERANETWSVSSLILTPMPADNGAVVKCVATNPSLHGSSMEDTIQMNVVCEYFYSFSLENSFYVRCSKLAQHVSVLTPW